MLHWYYFMKRQWCVDSTNLSETWNLQIGQFQNDMHVGHGRLFLRPQATIIYNFHKNQQIKVKELMSQKLILQYPFNSMFKYEIFFVNFLKYPPCKFLHEQHGGCNMWSRSVAFRSIKDDMVFVRLCCWSLVFYVLFLTILYLFAMAF